MSPRRDFLVILRDVTHSDHLHQALLAPVVKDWQPFIFVRVIYPEVALGTSNNSVEVLQLSIQGFVDILVKLQSSWFLSKLYFINNLIRVVFDKRGYYSPIFLNLWKLKYNIIMLNVAMFVHTFESLKKS